MKKLLFSAAALCCFVSAHAQWANGSGATATTTDITQPINRTGNVGIGTFTPKSKLDLGGNFAFDAAAPNKISLYWQANNNYYGFGISPGSLDYFTAGHHRFLAFDAAGTLKEAFYIGQNGNVGIGTTAPKSRLDLAGGFGAPGDAPNKINLYWQSSNNYYGFGVSAGNLDYFSSGTHRFHAFDAGGTLRETFSIGQSGNVVIGTPTPAAGVTQGNYKLNVWGPARANEIVVNTTGADFVFADNYRLRPLKEVEQFITANNHLPEIPSAKEMQENGMAVGELQTKLLQKVEELTLYVIEQNKQLQELKEENQELKTEVQKLK